MTTEESRIAPRKVLRCNAQIFIPGAPSRKVRTKDISMSGICLLADEQVPAGLVCGVAFDILLHGVLRKFRVVSKVIYCIFSSSEGFRVGCQFTELDVANTAIINEIMR